mmetsp:Transcript_84692/g.248299  ORF Transcript_84692/g.248299 Transcript_84692/m.248299 type:complete len:103 (-) Transcript_84692:10-318(-)
MLRFPTMADDEVGGMERAAQDVYELHTLAFKKAAIVQLLGARQRFARLLRQQDIPRQKPKRVLIFGGGLLGPSPFVIDSLALAIPRRCLLSLYLGHGFIQRL